MDGICLWLWGYPSIFLISHFSLASGVVLCYALNKSKGLLFKSDNLTGVQTMLNNATSGENNKGVAVSDNVVSDNDLICDACGCYPHHELCPVMDDLRNGMKEKNSFPVMLFNKKLDQLSIDELNEVRSALTGAVISFENDLEAACCAVAPVAAKIRTIENAKALAMRQLVFADNEYSERYAIMRV